MKTMRPPGPYVDGLIDLCQVVKETLKPNRLNYMAEIGCHIGESTKIFCEYLKPSFLYAVDPWVGGFDPRDPLSIDYDEDYFKIFKYNTYEYSNIVAFRKTSVEMATQIAKHFPKFIFVYLDAIHTYPAVKQDIKLWSKRIVRGGWIGGHDYSDPYFAGVKEAVDEMLGPPDYVFQDTSWLKRIK